MVKKTLLTASHVRYLIALKRLHQEDGIKSSEIAEELNLSRPSIHHMMETFLILEYIEKEPGGQVFLTKYGYQRASFFEDHYYKIRTKIFRALPMDDSVDRAICAMLAELSEENICRLI